MNDIISDATLTALTTAAAQHGCTPDELLQRLLTVAPLLRPGVTGAHSDGHHGVEQGRIEISEDEISVALVVVTSRNRHAIAVRK